jgi:hypothetical protein
MDTTYILDNFVQTKLGDPYRLFAFGTVVKNGKRRDITPEYAARFSLPHFSPPIKLGSHEDTTPAGGHITALEIREDGLYAVPEWNEAGQKAIQEGAYRYHSPEVLWDDGALENPDTGAMINGPLILGCALLHTPHLGQQAALYTVEIQTEESMDNVTIPASMWEKYIAPIFAREPEKVEVVKEPEDYAATKIERDELKAKIEKQVKETERKARVEKFDAELKETKADPTLADLLADLPEEKAGEIMKQFKALSAQIDDSVLLKEKGAEGAGGEASDDPQAAFNTVVLSVVKEKGILYPAAFEQVKRSNPDLFNSAFKK